MIYDCHILKREYFVNLQATYFMNYVLSNEFYANTFPVLVSVLVKSSIKISSIPCLENKIFFLFSYFFYLMKNY